MNRKPVTLAAIAVVALIACNGGSTPNNIVTGTPEAGANRSSNALPVTSLTQAWSQGFAPATYMGYLQNLLWSKNGANLIVQSSNLGIFQINSSDGQDFKVLDGQNRYYKFSISPDETKILKENDGNPIFGLNLTTVFTQPVGYKPYWGGGNRPFSWNNDGTSLVGIEGDYFAAGVTIWDTVTGQVKKRLRSNSGFTRFTWSSDNSFILASTNYSGVSLIDAQTGLTRCSVTSGPYSPSWNSARLAKNNSFFAIEYSTSDYYNPLSSIVIYRTSDCSVFKTIAISSAIGGGYSVGFEWSPNSASLAVFTQSSLSIWDVATGVEQSQLPATNVYVVSWKPDGSKIAAATQSSGIEVFDISTRQKINEFNTISEATGHTVNVYGVSWSPDGSRIADASRDSRNQIRDSNNGQSLFSIQSDTNSSYAIAYNQAGTTIATAGESQIINLWNATTGKNTAALTGHTFTVRGLAWKPSGDVLASASWDRTIKLWDPTTGNELRTLTGHSDFVNAVAFNPTGSRLASASSDKTIKFWDPLTGELLRTLTGHTGGVFALAWSPDGSKIASAGADKTVRIWNVTTGSVEKTLNQFLKPIRAVVWTKDGSGLIAGGDDGKISLWDVNSEFNSFIAIPAPGYAVFSLALSPDGTKLISGSANGVVTAWSLQ
jgi:WD40 repeat protein